MENSFGFHDRRDAIRLGMDYPALYTRFDNRGRAWDQKISHSINVSVGGVKLQSSFPVDSGELLDISMAIGDNVVTFKGKVAYVRGSEDQGFEMGISIEDIEDQDKICLARFIHHFRESSQREERGET